MKKILLLFLFLLALCSFSGCSKKHADNEIIVYNWGEYLDLDLINEFEEETGYKVVYEEFTTNEEMYPKIKSGAIAYDLVCPSDYMIQKMIRENMLEKIDFKNVPNIKNIDEKFLEKSKTFDSTNEYSIPYCWGTVGILYNTKLVKEPVDSWDILWDKKYKNQILMQDSIRDAFSIPLKMNKQSLNCTDEDELKKAADMLIKQKPLVQAYVIDQVRDKMIGNEAALGVIYSGEATYTQEENEDLAYVVPKEGSNAWIDSWVIPKGCQNKKGAEAFLNFLCSAEAAYKNFEYIYYSTPNKAAVELIDEEERENTTLFPDDATIERCEAFSDIGPKNDRKYYDLWKKIKAE